MGQGPTTHSATSLAESLAALACIDVGCLSVYVALIG